MKLKMVKYADDDMKRDIEKISNSSFSFATKNKLFKEEMLVISNISVNELY